MARAVQGAAQHVAAQGIGAQQVVPAGRLQPAADHVQRVMRRHDGRRDGGQQPEQHQQQANDQRQGQPARTDHAKGGSGGHGLSPA
jgi:hypothetical protein